MFIDSKYKNWYYNIISNARNRATSRAEANKILGYSERHHVIPKCMGGQDNKENLVYLSSREHFLCHLLLVKFVEKDYVRKMKYALGKFIQCSDLQNRLINSRQYDIVRKYISEARRGHKHTPESIIKISEGHKGQIPWNKGLNLPSISDDHKKALSSLYKGKSYEERYGDRAEEIKLSISNSKFGKSSGMAGKVHKEETKEKMRKPKPEDFGQKISKARTGIKFSEEHLENLKKANIENGIKRKGIKRLQLTCPHCKKIGGNSQMKRYHFDNCKKAPF